MATLGSASSLEQIRAEYADTASYSEDGDAAKARRFVTACRLLVLRTPAATSTREAQLQLRPDLIQKEMEAAIAWLQAHAPAPTAAPAVATTRARTVSFESFR